MKRDIPPLPPKGILVAVDLSTISLTAADQAARLAQAFGIPLEAVYVNERHPSVPVGDERVRLTSPLKRKVVEDIHRRLGAERRVHVLDGDPLDCLRQFAGTKKGYWLAMGTHGRTGLRRLLLGSVAEGMVLRAPIPVLTARDGARDIRKVLAPVTAGRQSWHGFQFAAELAWRLGARLTPIHVALPGESRDGAAELLARLRARLPPAMSARCAKGLVTAARKVELGVVKAASRHDLVVLTADREAAFSELLLGPTSARILRFSTAPVLVVPAGIPSRVSVWGNVQG